MTRFPPITSTANTMTASYSDEINDTPKVYKALLFLKWSEHKKEKGDNKWEASTDGISIILLFCEIRIVIGGGELSEKA